MHRLLAPAAVVLALVLTGCGTAGSTGGAGTEPSSPPSSPADAESVAEPGGTDTDAGKVDAEPVSKTYAFTAETVAGEAFDGATLAGKPTVLWFWAPWCPTCRAQIDGVSTLAQANAGSVNVVGVGGLDESAAIGDFAEDVPAQEVVQLSDPDGSVWRHFEITTQSSYVVLDADGTTVASGYLDDDELVDVVADLAG